MEFSLFNEEWSNTKIENIDEHPDYVNRLYLYYIIVYYYNHTY